ncbi:MAG: hypothetical protein ACYC55_09180 [Candidatus Geothermincolia bacterium]
MFEFCPECDVPCYVTREHRWLSSGAIVLTHDPSQRVVFLESANLDGLFEGISSLIGTSIDRIVIEAARKATFSYMKAISPPDVREKLARGEMDPVALAEASFLVAGMMGYGKPNIRELRFHNRSDDYLEVSVDHPYCVPLLAGNFTGTMETFLGRHLGVDYDLHPSGSCSLRMFEKEHATELHDRLHMRGYSEKPGNITYERCGTCGGPWALSEYRWDLERGTIVSAVTGKRMAILGPSMLDSVFRELEAELGADVMRSAIEAQRLFTATGFYKVEEMATEEAVRCALAIRGLGEILSFEVSPEGMNVSMASAVLAPMLVGLAQGMFEQATGGTSGVEWKSSSEGELTVAVKPLA